ncbi:MFS transporter [Rhodococcus ruber]|uniref:Drug resistance transporter, EmrB/QacA subfamily n=1 Tax=Rhodococcus ruber TaxID=1830 RepID=A0A098BMT2_9NOCA|nr:MFS transporter [Rhodococcus ruber]MCD2127225.1 MFS transporter [Rhodococcus ruber]MCZ4503178.1 MFS transporter [Rhodococcus ruber]MCZ4530727.1 MFS transporter [Rhodococcus ruber]MCZ4621573.1 MFS transporter [Rhodococcus ruber]MDI9969457.1 MFS transporter [Rhodococcus ruber]
MKPNPHRQWWALAALALAVLTLGFDITILNVALPTIATDLSASTSALQWMVNAYVLVMAGLMLTCGALGDRYGRKRLIAVALVVFGAASAAAAWAPTAGWAIGARAVMGVGAAILMPVAFAVVAALFAPRERGKAVAALVMATGIGIPLGPLIAGYLLEHFWWGSVFLINVPLAAAALAAIAAVLPESRDPDPRRLDVVGALSSTAGLSIGVYAVIAAPTRGWTDPVVIACLLAAAALLTGFARWELRTGDPMIDLRLFGRPQFLWSSVAGMLVSFGLLGILFVIPQYMQLVAGHDAFGTGLRLLPLIAGLVIGAPAGERLAARLAYRVPVAAGLAALAAGVTLGATTSITSGYGFVAGWLFLAGLGTGMALAPAMDAVLDALPTEHAGAGTAVTMTLRQVGGALGVAVLGSVLAQGYTDRLDTVGLPTAAADTARDSLAGALAIAARLNLPEVGLSAQAAYLHGIALVLLVTAALALLGACVTIARLPGHPPAADSLTPVGGINDEANRN